MNVVEVVGEDRPEGSDIPRHKRRDAGVGSGLQSPFPIGSGGVGGRGRGRFLGRYPRRQWGAGQREHKRRHEDAAKEGGKRGAIHGLNPLRGVIWSGWGVVERERKTVRRAGRGGPLRRRSGRRRRSRRRSSQPRGNSSAAFRPRRRGRRRRPGTAPGKDDR